MAKTLWGKVYFQDQFAGKVQEEPGGRVIFTYDTSYLETKLPAISYTLPLLSTPYVSESGLHSFFDNLVAEGWLKNAQAKALGISANHRFGLLLGFGFDLAGAVSVIDPEREETKYLDHADDVTLAALQSRASLSGVQRKLLIVRDGKQYRPAGPGELSTHIAKLPSGNLANLIELEHLTTLAVQKLLPDDDIVQTEIASITAIKEQALVIPRFDRIVTEKNVKRIHFEEFNQLLGRSSGDAKYEGAYEDMGQFLMKTPGCIPAEAGRLLRRVFACLLIGNTDAHLKNFALFHTSSGLRLTPAYDLVASSVYPEYQSIALAVSGIRNLGIGKLQPKHLLSLGERFGLNQQVVSAAIQDLGKQLPLALESLSKLDVGSKKLRNQLSEKMEKRWNGSFKSTGPLLSKKQNKDAKRKG